MEDKNVREKDNVDDGVFSFKKPEKQVEKVVDEKIVNYEPVEKPVDDTEFKFKKMTKEIDEELDKKPVGKPIKPDIPHMSEKIKFGLEIKHNLPDEGYLTVKADKVNVHKKDGSVEEKVMMTSYDPDDVEHVEIVSGLFKMDFRDDANFWYHRSPSTVPGLIKEAVITNKDIKDCYKFDKRKPEIPIYLIAGIAICIIIFTVAFISMVM